MNFPKIVYSRQLFKICAYSYLTIPVLVFLIGWVKTLLAIPAVVGIAICLVLIFKQEISFEAIEISKADIEKVVFAFGIIALWVLVSGIGGLSVQSEDHNARNGMFETLINNRWPIVGEISNDGQLVQRGFSYYLGFWMVPSVLGKVFGVRAGYYFQIVWAIIGICIFYFGICYYRHRFETWPFILFILFSGLDIIGWYVTGFNMAEMTAVKHLEWWTPLQFTSNTSQLFWVFNQCIPAWIVTMLFLIEKRSRNMLYLFSVSLISCILPCVGLIPLGVYKVFTRIYINKKEKMNSVKEWLKDVLTFQNVFGMVVLGGIFASFLWKPSSTKPMSLFARLRHGGWMLWIVSLLIEIGVYIVLVYHRQKKNKLFWIVICWLTICPLIPAFGGYNFCMRASIPELIVLVFFIIEEIEGVYKTKSYVRLAILIVVLSIGAITPFHEFNRSITGTINAYNDGSLIRTEPTTFEEVLGNDYEAIDVEKSIFYRFLAKQP